MKNMKIVKKIFIAYMYFRNENVYFSLKRLVILNFRRYKESTV